MTLALKEPTAAADPVELADYLELLALQADDGSASIMDLRGPINIAGTAELLDLDPDADAGLTDPEGDETVVDPGGEVLESRGAAAEAEVIAREVSCGGAYPFELDANGVLSLSADAMCSPYIFMLLLTRFGSTPMVGKARISKIDAAKTFENLATVAAFEYFGSQDAHTLVYPFGAPREEVPKGFRDAVDDLCLRIGEGSRCKPGGNLSDQQDGKLDIVVVRRFPDGRAGQMMGFGQCATGADWRDKLSELDPRGFCSLWMMEQPAVLPIRMFFVPHTIEDRRWMHANTLGGIVFDRCRMAYHSTYPGDEALQRKILDWSTAVVDAKVAP